MVNMVNRYVGRLMAWLSVAVLFASCNKGAQKEQDVLGIMTGEKEKLVWTLSPTAEILPHPHGMALADSTIYVAGLYQGAWVHGYDKYTGKNTVAFMNEGHGHDEAIQVADINTVDSHLLSAYDMRTKALSLYDLKSDTVSATERLDDVARVIWYGWALSDKKALIKYPDFLEDKTISRAFAIVDLKNEQIVSEYKALSQEFAENVRLMAGQSTLTISPDKKHFASATLLGGTLELFEIADSGITPVYSKVVHPMTFVEKNGVPRVEGNWYFAFVASCSSDDKVYISYAASENADEATKLSVWDWNGKLLKCYDTDRLIYNIVYDAEGEVIYGVVEGEEGPVLAKLPRI